MSEKQLVWIGGLVGVTFEALVLVAFLATGGKLEPGWGAVVVTMLPFAFIAGAFLFLSMVGEPGYSS